MKTISKAAVLALALVIGAFVFGQILSSSAQTSGPPSADVDCSDIAPWSATKRYVTYNERVVYLDKAYRQNFESTNKPPDQNSGPWGEPWIPVGDCDGTPPDNRPPTGTLAAPTTVASGASATFTVTASDPDGDTLTYTWTRPQGFTGDVGNTATVTLTAPTVPADQQATISVQVADGRGGTLPLNKTFTVEAGGPANRPPTVTLEGPATVNSGGNVTFAALASDPDGDPLTYTWTPPEGFTSGNSNGNWASMWAPTVPADRQATANVQVSDGRGGTATSNKTITVKAAPSQPPTVVVTGPTTVEAGTDVTLDASGSTGNNPGGGQLNFIWTIPAGIVPEAATSPAFQFVAPTVTANTSFVFTVRVDQGASHATKSHTVTVTPKQGGPCSVEEYRNGHAYAVGDQVSHHGELYTCKQSGWCGQGPYEPGKPWNGQEIWRDAWTHDGKCDSGEQGNVLTLEFSPQPTYVSKQQRLRQPKPLSGVLRCGAEETPISADWGETLPIKGLRACKYQLILNAATTSGHMPFRAPRLIEFKNESGETRTEEIDYVRPVNLDQLKPLPGVKIEVFAQGLLEPRQMALGKGVVYVGSSALPYGAQPDVGNFIYALPLDGSGKVQGIYVIASGLEEPHGVAYRNGDLYYSTSDGIYRMRGIDTAYANPPAAEKIRSFPSDEDKFPIPGQGWPDMNWRRWHMKHPIMFNPVNPGDPWLYSMVGRVCNTCIMQPDSRYGTLIRYNVDTGAEQVIAYGVRNSVGWDWDPRTGDIWWSDNNRQRMYNGDEMNRLVKPGEGPAPHFGSPYMYAHNLGFTPEEWATPSGRLEAMGYASPVNGVVLSDKSPDQIDPNQYEAPSFVMGSGTAPLGVKFWNGYRPQAGMQQLLFATHSLGSNPREAGLEVDMLIIDSQSKVVAETPLITGWQKNYGEGGTNCKDGCSGRPVEFLTMPDGSLLVSDDIQGVIYRVTYDALGLPGTLLKLRAPTAPDESIAKQMVTGSLTDIAGGVVRKFAVAWGSDALEFPGLPAGQYSLRLEDVGDWVPGTRVTPISLSGSSVFDFTYEPRQDGTGTITVTAPSKPNPRLMTESLDVQVVGVGGDGGARHVAVPWGESGSVTVPYGTYIVRSPFVSPSFRPEPSIAMVDVEQGSNPAPVAMQYEYVDSLGHAIITKTCNGCHSYAFFDDPKKADRWERDGVEALIATIKGMNVAGHCDDVCAGETAEYLYNVVWHPYLKPEADSSTRQVRLLTRDEYRNSVQDVLGVQLNSELIPDDTIDLEFRYPGLADLGVINKANVGLYYELAVRVARQVDVQQLGFQQGGDNKAFVESLGRRLYRNRLTAEQSADMVAYLQEHGPNDLVAAMLVSPYFLYRSELGDDSEGGLFRLTQSEIATLLSFGFLGTTPSVDLMDKAEAGLLDTPDAIQAEVENMLSTERGQEQFARFVRYYDRSYKVVGDKPGLDDPTIADMRRELDTFSKQLIAKPTATMNELFNPGYTFLNERLARHYGVNGVSGEAMQRVNVDRTRGGLLHMGIMHVSNSDNTATSLVKRGKMLREQMFCKTVGAGTGLDPEDVTFPTEPYTTRTYWTLITGEHASSGQCWGCHVYMNYGGASFENYAADGRYRIVEKAYNNASVNVPIDASGVLADNTGLANWMSFEDARDISEHMPENADARDCLARSYYGYVQGEQPTAGGRQTVKAMSQDLAAGGLLHKMLATLATSDALLYRKEGD